MIVKDCTGATLFNSAIQTVSVNNPVVVSTTPATRCGAGPLTLNATSNVGTSLFWYDGLGAMVGSGSSFITPSIATTTNYTVKAANSQTGISFNGDGAWNHVATAGAFQTSAITSAYMILTVNTPIALESLDIYPSATVGTAFTIEARTGSASGTAVSTYSGTTTVTNSVTPSTAQNVPVSWTLNPGTYYIGFTTNPNTWRSSATHTFPWSTPSGSASMSFYLTPAYQYFFYNLKVTDFSCISAGVPVAATINSAPSVTVTASQDTICSGRSSLLTATSSNLNYTYSWSPVVASGSTVSVSPTANTAYMVTASDLTTGNASSGCSISSNINIAVKSAPTNVTVASTLGNLSCGDIARLTATGGTISNDIVIGTGTAISSTTTYPAPFSNYYGGGLSIKCLFLLLN